jgi:hypothetical protein
MIKSFLISISFSTLLFSAQQIILVVADDFKAKQAQLEFFEDNNILFSTTTNIGTNGLGWGLGEVLLEQKEGEPLKHEGDMKAPAGIFKLTEVFGYAHRPLSNLPYLFASKELICVDENSSNFYNQIIMKKGNEKSFEYMKREDEQYLLGIVVAHNQEAKEGRGSCIFIHVQKEDNATTAGCTTMTKEELQKVLQLLDKHKNPLLIQIPKSSSKEILKLYPQLKNSNLLHPHQNSHLAQ